MLKIKNIISAADDRLNPVLIKELRQATNGKYVRGILSLLTTALLCVLCGMLFFSVDLQSDISAGKNLFIIFLMILAVGVLVFIPLQQSKRFYDERNNKTMELLYTSTISPFKLILGKYFTGNIIALQLFSVCLPFMTICYLLRGIDVLTISTWAFVLFLFFQPLLMLFLLLGALPVSTLFFRAIMLMAGIGIFTLAVNVSDYRFFAGSLSVTDKDFLLILLTITAVFLEITGFAFLLAAAAVSSSPSNRAMPLRVYIFAVFLLNQAPAFFFPHNNNVLVFTLAMDIIFFIISIVGMIVACNERYEYNIRILKQIPRNKLKRLVVFPFFTGAANGILFFILLSIVSSIAALNVYLRRKSVFLHELNFWDSDFPIMPGSLMYIFFVSVMAYLIKKKIFMKRFPRIPATAYALQLIFLSALLPFILTLVYTSPRNMTLRNVQGFYAFSFMGSFFSDVQKTALIFDSVLFVVALVFFIPLLSYSIKKFKPYESDRQTEKTESAKSAPSASAPAVDKDKTGIENMKPEQ